MLTTTQIYDPATAQWSRGTDLPAPRAVMTGGYWQGQIYLAAGTNSVQFAPQGQVWAYDPLLDTWNTSLLPLQAPTMGAAGGIIDGQLLLAGGADNQAHPLSWLLYYDVATQQRGFHTDLPLPVYGAGGAVVNGQLWVFGGGQPFAGLAGAPRLDLVTPHALNLSEIYDPFTNQWQAGPPLNVARALTAGTAVGNAVIAVGGLGGAGDLDSVEVAGSLPSTRCPTITPTPTLTGTPPTATATATPTPTQCGIWGTIDPWAIAGSFPPPLAGNGMTSDGRYLYTAGGGSDTYYHGTTEFAHYNPANSTWTPLAPLLTLAVYGSLTYAPNVQELYYLGGANDYVAVGPMLPHLPRARLTATAPARAYDYVQIYDPATNQWSFGAPMPEGREFISTAYYDGKIYLPGGAPGDAWIPRNQLWAYDPMADRWDTSLPNLPIPLMEAATGAINGHLYVAGGGQNGNAALATLFDYDIATRTWYTRTPLLQATAGAQSLVLGGRLWVIGGGTPYNGATAPTALNTVQIYDPLTDSWSWGPPLTGERRMGGGAALGGQAYLFGGWDVNYTPRDSLETTIFHPSLPCPTRTVTPPPPISPTFTPSTTPCALTFSDVPPGSPFYNYIRCLACREIVSGYSTSPPCTTGVPCFLPGATVTRGQTAKFIANTANYQDPIPATQQTFSDVPPGHPFWLYVERAARHGVISSYSNSPPCTTGVPCFLPGNAVTRGQTAKFVSNAANYQDPIPATQQTFSDVPYGHPFWLYIERSALHGVISGYSSSPPCTLGAPCFLPGNAVTRGQTAKFIANAFYPSCQTPQR